ncbi:thioredoxin family protein [Priestia megaterium]|uniref:thioredoxin family protein n=1 Tax=Priestia megaterium TaxID=1404 RepID=UPI0002F1CEF9|nr:thioredoxin family protein [Priestia megaterium]
MKMSKKIWVSLSLILILIAGLFFMINKQYHKKEDLYSTQTSPAQLKKDIEKKGDVFAYYYQINCVHCQKVSPYLIPLGKKQNIEFEILNLEKYKKGWEEFRILQTPTLVHYKDGQEVNRITGEHSEKDYKSFFKNN